MRAKAEPTAVASVNAAVAGLAPAIERILPGVVGIYITGSLTTGDFDAGRSDLDLTVVTREALTADQVAELRDLHRRFDAVSSPWQAEVEVTYVAARSLRRFDDSLGLHAHLGRGEELEVRPFDRSWDIELHLFREHAVTVVGPSPGTLAEPVSALELSRAAAIVIREWLVPLADSPERINSVGYQTFLVLSTCRALHTLTTGIARSKQVSAAWALDQLEPALHPSIERAMAWVKTDPQLPVVAVDGTTDLIRQAAVRAVAWEAEHPQ